MKKVVSLILTLVFVVGMCSTAAFAAGGDVNNDNTVNAADLLALEQHILGVNVIDDIFADVDEEPEIPEIGDGIEDGGIEEL